MFFYIKSKPMCVVCGVAYSAGAGRLLVAEYLLLTAPVSTFTT